VKGLLSQWQQPAAAAALYSETAARKPHDGAAAATAAAASRHFLAAALVALLAVAAAAAGGAFGPRGAAWLRRARLSSDRLRETAAPVAPVASAPAAPVLASATSSGGSTRSSTTATASSGGSRRNSVAAAGSSLDADGAPAAAAAGGAAAADLLAAFRNGVATVQGSRGRGGVRSGGGGATPASAELRGGEWLETADRALSLFLGDDGRLRVLKVPRAPPRAKLLGLKSARAQRFKHPQSVTDETQRRRRGRGAGAGRQACRSRRRLHAL
jgi:hypothetical protein